MNLVWDDAAGLGFALTDEPTRADFFEEYAPLEDTPSGKAINGFRADLVKRICPHSRCLDIGIGNGAFIKAHGNCAGFDVDPKSIEWLQERDLFCDPHNGGLTGIDCVTFWDSLEHFHAPSDILGRLGHRPIFMSLPIFASKEHCLSSKHYKPGEHIWYYTRDGLKRYMQTFGYECVYSSRAECEFGREDIETFVFTKPEREQ